MTEVAVWVLAVGSLWLAGLVMLLRLLSFNRDEHEGSPSMSTTLRQEPTGQPSRQLVVPDQPDAGTVDRAS